jgi:hypothetical protein
MGRKSNKGKARRAAKAKAAKARDEAEASRGGTVCMHGVDILSSRTSSFVKAFRGKYNEALRRSKCVPTCLNEADNAITRDGLAGAWNDTATMKSAMSFFLCLGTHAILDNKYDDARDSATIARFLEQHIATELKTCQALPNWPKISETYHADLHTLVKFYRNRIPCSCLDEKYEVVKHITKVGFCYNAECKFHFEGGGRTERSKTKYCSRCRCATYCSRECQEAQWSDHKPYCDKAATIISKFEAKQQK